MNFIEFLTGEFTRRRTDFSKFYDESDAVARRLFPEYGAVFAAGGDTVAPDRIVFRNAREVAEFQAKVRTGKAVIGGFELELQAAAMDDLLGAVADAERAGLTLNPRGADSAKRDYAGTVALWESRVAPALEHWTGEQRLSRSQAESIRRLSPFEQVPEVFKLEEQEIWFSKDLSKSIIYSVAPPGTSQHLAMLAFDAAEFQNEEIRRILARRRWFQTVVSDLPHFTYLGVTEEHLPARGLKKVEFANQTFWVPQLPQI